MASTSTKHSFDLNRAKDFVSAANEMRTQHGWPDSAVESQRRLMKAVLTDEYDGPLWVFFGPNGAFRGGADCQSAEAEEIKFSGRIEKLFGNELSVFSEGGETTAADWLPEFWLDFARFQDFKTAWKERHSGKLPTSSSAAEDGEEAVRRPGVERGRSYFDGDPDIERRAKDLWQSGQSETKSACISEAAADLNKLPSDIEAHTRLVNRLLARIRRSSGWPKKRVATY